jgi:hypothetical protein
MVRKKKKTVEVDVSLVGVVESEEVLTQPVEGPLNIDQHLWNFRWIRRPKVEASQSEITAAKMAIQKAEESLTADCYAVRGCKVYETIEDYALEHFPSYDLKDYKDWSYVNEKHGNLKRNAKIQKERVLEIKKDPEYFTIVESENERRLCSKKIVDAFNSDMSEGRCIREIRDQASREMGRLEKPRFVVFEKIRNLNLKIGNARAAAAMSETLMNELLLDENKREIQRQEEIAESYVPSINAAHSKLVAAQASCDVFAARDKKIRRSFDVTEKLAREVVVENWVAKKAGRACFGSMSNPSEKLVTTQVQIAPIFEKLTAPKGGLFVFVVVGIVICWIRRG